MNQNILNSFSKYPEFLSSADLVELGFYPSMSAAHQARADGGSPEYIKLKHKVLYPKYAVIGFLESRLNIITKG